MLVAYLVIVVGGISLCGRLDLLGMAVAFYITFAIGVGVLAVLGQSITTQWSLTPIDGVHYWWMLVTSPETLIFLFFMITDPKTTPAGRLPEDRVRRCRGGDIDDPAGAVADRIRHQGRAAQRTGRGVRRRVRSSSRGCQRGRCDARRRHPSPARLRNSPPTALDRGSRDDRRDCRIGAVVGDRRSAEPQCGGGRAPAGGGRRLESIRRRCRPSPIDDEVAGLSAELATQQGAQALAAALAFNLAVEAEAIRSRRRGSAARRRPRRRASRSCRLRSPPLRSSPSCRPTGSTRCTCRSSIPVDSRAAPTPG